MNHKLIKSFIGIFFLFISLIYLIWYGVANRNQFPDIAIDVGNFVDLTAATATYLIAMLLSVFAWHLLLRGVGVTTRFQNVTAVFLLSQFAKYIPGNVAQHIGRVALARAYGFPVSRVLFTMALEIALVVAVSCVLGIGGVLSLSAGVFGTVPAMPPIWKIALIGGGISAAPFACLWLLNRYRPGPIRRLMGEQKIPLPRASLILLCCAIYVANYGLLGFALNLLAQSVFGAVESHIWALTGIFAIAWVAGFVTPGAPGGLGVREAILASAMTPFYGAGVAVALALTLRLVTTAGDGLGFCAGLVLRKFSARSENNGSSVGL